MMGRHNRRASRDERFSYASAEIVESPATHAGDSTFQRAERDGPPSEMLMVREGSYAARRTNLRRAERRDLIARFGEQLLDRFIREGQVLKA